MKARHLPRGRALRVAHITTVDLTLWFMLRGQLERLVKEGYEVTGISAPGDYAKELSSLGIRHIAWGNATRGWNPFADLKAFIELFRILRRERFDIVHTHNPKPGVMGRIAARLAGVPLVVNTVHGLYATPTDPPLRKGAVLSAEWLAARFSDVELFQSEEDFRWARRIGLSRPPKAALLGNGIDLVRFDPVAVTAEHAASLRDAFGIARDTVVVGAVGRMVVEKGYRELFAAAERVRERLPETVFLVVGGADPEKWDAFPADEIERAKRHVIFAGQRDDVRDLLGIMDVYVLASWREGLPRSAVEAAAMGKAMVLTDIRGCREVVRDGVDGKLVPAKDAERLADAIEALVRDPSLRARFGAAVRGRALDRFDERNVEEIVLERYRVATQESRPADLSRIDIRAARPADIPTLARLHRETVPTAFLPLLGERFMRLLYRALLDDPGGVASVIEDGNGEVVGFASGAVSVPDFYRRFFRRHGARAALVAAPRLLRPSMIRRALETARVPRRVGDFPQAEIFIWGLDRRARKSGLSLPVLMHAVEEFGRLGAQEARGIVYAENERANKVLYDGGWRVRGQVQVHSGQVSNVWVHACPSPSASR